MKKFAILVLALAAAIASLVPLPAKAQVVLFSSRQGDIKFPGLTPTTIDAMAIGQTTPAPGKFTTLNYSGATSGAGNTANFASPPPIGATTPNTIVGSSLQSDTGTKTATASAGAATLNKTAGVVTSEALTTAAGATYALNITNSTAAAADQVFASVQYGTSTTGTPTITTVATSAGHVIITVQNIHASAALNGTIKISYLVMKN